MLHLIPAPLHRLLYRIADRTRRRWWRFRRSRRNSVFVVAFDEQGQVLLVRHSYGPPVWALPGGGLGRRENPLPAAVREFREELKCEPADLRLLKVQVWEDSGSHDRRHVFVATLRGTPVPDQREVVEAALFDPQALPGNTGHWAASVVREAVAWRQSNES